MSTEAERIARNKKFDCLSPIEITVFNPIPDDPDNIFRTSPGDAQLHIDGEWDERDNWTPHEMRCAAQALIDAADYAESLGADLGVSSAEAAIARVNEIRCGNCNNPLSEGSGNCVSDAGRPHIYDEADLRAALDGSGG